MLRDSVIGIWNNSINDFNEYLPKVYFNSQWVLTRPYVYSNGAWRPVGQAGTLMIPFVTSTSDQLYVNGELFQVRRHD